MSLIQGISYHLHKFLFDTQVMVCDSKHSDSVFEFLGDLNTFSCTCSVALFSLLILIRKKMHQQSCLYDHDRLVCVIHSNVVSVEL